jgi:hypothetical protein
VAALARLVDLVACVEEPFDIARPDDRQRLERGGPQAIGLLAPKGRVGFHFGLGLGGRELGSTLGRLEPLTRTPTGTNQPLAGMDTLCCRASRAAVHLEYTRGAFGRF